MLNISVIREKQIEKAGILHAYLMAIIKNEQTNNQKISEHNLL